MRFNTEKLKEKAIKAIKEKELIFVEDVCAAIGIDKGTFYNHFPVNFNDFNELKELIEENKISIKTKLRKKWLESDNATTQVALYKLCSTPEEHKKLQQNYVDVDAKLKSDTISKEEFLEGIENAVKKM